MTKRDLCIGNCGRFVISNVSAECRKCRRKRLRVNLKRTKRNEKAMKRNKPD